MGKLVAVCLFAGMGALAAGMSGCGKANIFSWAHQPGASSNVPALSSDAYTALRDKDYARALEYFQRILDSDPDNSEAIYGYAAAKLAEAGLDISSLVANLVRQQQAPAINGLAPSLAYAAGSPGESSNLIPATIIARIQTVRAVLDDLLGANRLSRIVKGQGDGKIAPDNPDVNLNMAFCLVLRAALRVNDVIEFGGDYTTVNIKSGANLDTLSRESARDIVSAYQRLKVVAGKLNLADGSTIAQINADVERLFNSLKSALLQSGVDLDAEPSVSLNGNYL